MENNKNKDVFEFELIANYSDEIRVSKKALLDELKVLFAAKDFAAVLDRAPKGIAEMPSRPVGKGDQELSAIFLIYSTAIWEVEKDIAKANELARKAFHFDRSNKPALWLIRETKDVVSDESKLFRLEVTGEYIAPFEDGNKMVAFSTLYKVIADNYEEAFEFVRENERTEINEILQYKEHKELEPRPGEKKGIISTMDLVALNPGDVE